MFSPINVQVLFANVQVLFARFFRQTLLIALRVCLTKVGSARSALTHTRKLTKWDSPFSVTKKDFYLFVLLTYYHDIITGYAVKSHYVLFHF